MKTMQMIATGVAVAVMAYSNFGYAVTVNTTAAKAEIEFVDHDRFTDIRNDKLDSAKGNRQVLAFIERTFVETTRRHIPDGYKLRVRVTDIDLAGDYEPQPPNHGDVRILRDIYPPRISFEYEVVDANERVVRSGSERLTDPAYRQRLRMARHTEQTAPYVAELVRDWSSRALSRELANLDR